jgi:hypothetical protein
MWVQLDSMLAPSSCDVCLKGREIRQRGRCKCVRGVSCVRPNVGERKTKKTNGERQRKRYKHGRESEKEGCAARVTK